MQPKKLLLLLTLPITFCTTLVTVNVNAASETVNTKSPPTLFLVGDSTMAIKKESKRPETGWGEKFTKLFQPGITIENHAVNGRSTKSFIAEGRWQVITDKLQPGDVVFIQFGHNDQKVNDPARYTNPYSSYRNNLARYVKETRSKQATPVLLSSIVRRNFNDAGTLVDNHGPYPMVMRELAKELDVTFIDLNSQTEAFFSNLGPEKSLSYYLHVKPGINPNYPNGKTDNTHLTPLGAETVANMVASSLCKQGHRLKRFLQSCKDKT